MAIPTQNKNNQNSNISNNLQQQNKNRQELVLFHLQMLKYQNIPKLNILQNMTSSKNWIQMLLIIYFLTNSVIVSI